MSAPKHVAPVDPDARRSSIPSTWSPTNTAVPAEVRDAVDAVLDTTDLDVVMREVFTTRVERLAVRYESFAEEFSSILQRQSSGE